MLGWPTWFQFTGKNTRKDRATCRKESLTERASSGEFPMSLQLSGDKYITARKITKSQEEIKNGKAILGSKENHLNKWY